MQGLGEALSQARTSQLASESVVDKFIYYLLLYNNPEAVAKKGIEELTNSPYFGGWTEVKFASVTEIATRLRVCGVSNPAQTARFISYFLGELWEYLDNCDDLAPGNLNRILDKIMWRPKWSTAYLKGLLGLGNYVAWDPHVDRVATRLGIVQKNDNVVGKRMKLQLVLPPSPDRCQVHLNMLYIGQRFCNLETMKCGKCPLAEHCSTAKSNATVVQ